MSEGGDGVTRVVVVFYVFLCVLGGLQRHSIIHLHVESVHRDQRRLGQSLGETLFSHYPLLLFLPFIFAIYFLGGFI